MSADDRSDPRKDGPAKAASGNGPTVAEYRLARQKAALKANMARRKAQVRVSGDGPDAGSTDSNDKE
ncbi:MAG: hypothetical protein V4712_08325 [Pseudomonadota bacterium]